MPSNIRVEVAFERPVEFAGETVSAIITFKNITPSHSRVESRSEHAIPSGAPRASLSVTPRTQQTQSNGNPSPPAPSHTRRLSMQLASTLRGFYSLGNDSRENTRSPGSRSDLGRSSSFSTSLRPTVESLFMGYVQLQGYFQVDQTLIDTSVFQHARTHGIIVGRRGLEYSSEIQNGPNQSNGLLRNIGNFLFSTETTPTDGKQHATELSDEIPIFTTPQSLLFVDLKLSPGESRSYSYHVTLPKELPPSCRGKSIKIMYNMVIGTQKTPSRPGLPTPRIILVPFRLFSYVDPEGFQPTHDLSNPIVVARDESSVLELEGRRSSLKSFEALSEYRRTSHSTSSKPNPEKVLEDKLQFEQYVDNLLEHGSSWPGASPMQSKRNSFDPAMVLLGRRRSSTLSLKQGDKSKNEDGDEGLGYSVKDNINYFVKYYTQMGPQLSPDPQADSEHPVPRSFPFKFSYDIVRKDKKISTVNFSHSVYRVGDEIVAVLDMSDADIPCYHVTATLETTERILDSSICLESETKTQAITRRIYSHYVTSCFSASKTHIQLTIPSTATPQFSTSLISLNWSVRLDLITAAAKTKHGQSLFKTSNQDESCHIYTAKPVLPCESFSCRIPIHVYPTNQDISALLESYAAPQQRVWVI